MPLPHDKHRLAFPGIEGLYGYVSVDDEALEVHGVEVVDDKMIAYIEAKEGRQFEVRFNDQRRSGEDYAVRFFVDGSKVKGSVTEKASSFFRSAPDAERRVITVRGKMQDATTLLPFLFAPLATTDDDELACSDENFIKGLGSIQIKYHRVNNVHSSERPPPAAHSNPGPVHEHSKKAAVSHQAAYGAAVTVEPLGCVSYDHIDPMDSPLSTVEFRYRSRAILQFEDYIPADPAASPSPASPPASPIAGPSQPKKPPRSAHTASPISALDDDELDAEIERLERLERLAQLKREKRRRSGLDSPHASNGSSSSQAGKGRVKSDPDAEEEVTSKKVKREKEEQAVQQRGSKKKGKKPQVIDLRDSDLD
ncbi:hypothetical protein JCM11251_000242 [Rhodosporidiobolus azoricus]